MTIREAIEKTDAWMHNTYSTADKIGWLSKLDGMVMRQIISTHEGSVPKFDGYDEDTDREAELLVPEPYSEIYPRWLEAQINYANQEYSMYNNAILMFNTEYEAYQSYYNRNNMPKNSGRFLF